MATHDRIDLEERDDMAGLQLRRDRRRRERTHNRHRPSDLPPPTGGKFATPPAPGQPLTPPQREKER